MRYGKRVEVSSSLGPSSTEPYSQSKGIGISTHSGELGQKKLLALLPLDMTLLSVDVQCAREISQSSALGVLSTFVTFRSSI